MSIDVSELTYNGPLTEDGEADPHLAYFILDFIRRNPERNNQSSFVLRSGPNPDPAYDLPYRGRVTREEFCADGSYRACFLGLAILAVDGRIYGDYTGNAPVWRRAAELLGAKSHILGSTVGEDLGWTVRRTFGPRRRTFGPRPGL